MTTTLERVAQITATKLNMESGEVLYITGDLFNQEFHLSIYESLDNKVLKSFEERNNFNIFENISKQLDWNLDATINLFDVWNKELDKELGLCERFSISIIFHSIKNCFKKLQKK